MSLADLYNVKRDQVPANTVPGERVQIMVDTLPGSPTMVSVQKIGPADLARVKGRLAEASKTVTLMEGERNRIIKDLAEAEAKKAEAEKQLGVFDFVQILLEKSSAYAREQTKGYIEKIVSQALNVVYGGEHRFIIQLCTKANQPTAEYWLNDGFTMVKLERPDFESGGGKAEVIGLATVLAVAELMAVPGPIFLDEVGKQVDREKANDTTTDANLAYFLKQYAQEFDRQIILITHNETLAAIGDVSNKVIKRQGKAEVVAL